MTEGAIGPEHFIKLSLRLERQLQMEVYKDALAEVNLIKHNVVQAFLESAGDPTVVHNFVNVVSPCVVVGMLRRITVALVSSAVRAFCRLSGKRHEY